MSKKFFKSVNIWQSYNQERDCLVRLADATQKDGENARNNHVLACKVRWDFDIHLTTNLERNLPVKKFLKSVKN